MDDNRTYQQMQDEMSRFEAEISTNEGHRLIGSNTFGAVQQRLERLPPPPAPPMLGPFDHMMGPRMMFGNVPPPPPPPNMMVPASFIPGAMIGPFDHGHSMMGPRHMFGDVPPPLPPLNMMVPASVQRLRPMSQGFMPGPFMPQPMPGPQVIPKQAAVLSAAPKLYKKSKESKDMEKKEAKEAKKRKRSATPPLAPPPRAPSPPPVQPAAPPPPPVNAHNAHNDPPKPKKEKKHRKVVRTAGGQVWEDVTLLDWPDDDFRMFCGDLGNDVTDELLTRTFGKYTSFQRAKVVRDRRTNKSKGFGFVSFKDPGDFIKAMKEMDGRYVGSRPIKLRKSSWKSRSLDVVRKKEKEKAALLSLLMAGNKS